MNTREITEKINTKFKDRLFLEEICNLSHNSPRIVIRNIAIIISYYYSTGNIDEEINKILQDNKNTLQTDYLFAGSNTYYRTRTTLFGVNSKRVVSSRIRTLMYQLNNRMNRLSLNMSLEARPDIEHSVYKAIKSLPFFSMLSEENDIIPYKVRETQLDYYSRVMKIKMKKCGVTPIDEDYKLLEEIIGIFINYDPCLFIINKNKIKNTECIILPNIFQIMNMCAKNREIKAGTEINPNTGDTTLERIEEKKDIIEITYSRWEDIVIDENFIYMQDELTGDPKKDITRLYGDKDIHSSSNEEVLRRSYLENIDRIKKHNDISLQYRNGKYYIRNGRHRIVYMKYYYDINHKYYEEDKVKLFKKLFTIPANVSHKIEDKKINEIIQRMYEEYDIQVFKDNILNDEIEIGIVVNNCLYFIKGINELEELYKYIREGKYDNKYLFVKFNSISGLNYSEIIERIYRNKGEEITNISFSELLKLLPIDIVKIINPIKLYNYFTFFINNDLRNKLFKTNYSLFPNSRKRVDVIDKIIELLCDDSELLKLPVDILVKKIKENKEFKDISEEEIKSIIDKFGLPSDEKKNSKEKNIIL